MCNTYKRDELSGLCIIKDGPSHHVTLMMCVCCMRAEEVQQLRQWDLLDFSKDHSDPCWTGQTVEFAVKLKLWRTKSEKRDRDKGSVGVICFLKVNYLCEDQQGQKYSIGLHLMCSIDREYN